MFRIGGEVLFVLALVIANGVFAMSEIAVVSARKARLQQGAQEGDMRARQALELANAPDRFLSTVQIGITLVGILAGAFGGARIAEQIARYLERYPAVAPYSGAIGLGVVVVVITYLTLVIGELVPKRIALSNPERIASAIAGPMQTLSRISAPLVGLLTASTTGVIRLLRVRQTEEPPVSEEEITFLLRQGAQAGVFEAAEQEMVEGVFWLGEQSVASLMTPRGRIVWLDVRADPDQNREKMMRHRHTRYLVCDGGLDQVLGMVDVKDLLAAALAGRPVDDLRDALHKPLFMPESTRAFRLLEEFRESGTHLALVIDEYGGIQGLVTLNDMMEGIVGEVAQADGVVEPALVQREDGSWLVNGSTPMAELRDVLGVREWQGAYRTVGGFVITHLGRIPVAGDYFDSSGFRVEVMDMDGRRVDKVLVAPRSGPI